MKSKRVYILNNKKTSPNTIRYTPKTVKLCLSIYLINSITANQALIKETLDPNNKISSSFNPIVEEDFNRSYPVAVNIVGRASRNENSVACFLDNPLNIPPTIVAAALETPGITAKL